ncbi:sugar ABC transporter permease [Paenibacillus pasadenensis]|uniref:carbohydrate ABC transporter permease n=1 Tax=Paenibacillus pasadenensis TaxID=217090 RepID=UPI00203B00A5|nr:sugar ABC transporter permease [Paenibacillus pasadenensis]MCM3747227.1 sugar ABC transporter permease [Paenibacillus pasadenensis]
MVKTWKEDGVFLLFISPWIIGVLCFFVGPALASLTYSFADYNAITAPSWIGFDNYSRLWSDEVYLKSLRNTLYFVFIGVPITVGFQIVLSLMLNIEVPGIRYFRTLYYLPYLVPPVATVVIWMILFGSGDGVVNTAIQWLGGNPVDWMNSEALIKPVIITIGMWMSGGSVLVFLAGLKGIPRSLYEAARIDGSGPVRTFFNITLPMLTPSILFTVVMQVIYYFQMFTEAMLLSKGGPDYSSQTYMMNTYQVAFRDLDFGYAMAQSWVLFLIILVITVALMKSSNRWVYYEGEDKKGGKR